MAAAVFVGKNSFHAGGRTAATGAMAALIGPEDRIHELIRQTGVQVVISNRNSPRQLVVSGLAPQIETLVAQAKPAKLKAVPLNVKGLLGADKAIVSSGGVIPEEVDFKTMESRLVPNLYIVGDITHRPPFRWLLAPTLLDYRLCRW